MAWCAKMQYFFDTWIAFAHKREFTDAEVDGFPEPADIVELRAQHPAEHIVERIDQIRNLRPRL